jgi:tetratricopeptide (TPR) repeat protein
MSITNPAEPKAKTGAKDQAVQQAIEAAEAKAAAHDRDGAIAELERALSLDADSPFVLKILGGLLLEAGSHWEAQQRYRHLLRLQPDNAEVHVLSAVASLRMGRPDEFATAIGRALDLDPMNIPALQWRGRVAFDNENHSEAGRDYARLVDLGQVDVDTLTTLGVCLARGGQWEIAGETFAQAVVLHGTAEVARENLEVARRKLGRPASPVAPRSLLEEAGMDYERGNAALACWAWMEFLKSEPRNQEIRKNLVSVLVERKWTAPALPHLEELVRGNPWDPALGTWLALVRFETGHRAKALEALQSVFALDPQFLEARRLEVDLIHREGRHDEAWWLVQRLCRDHPDDVVARISRSVCAFHCKRWADAVADLEWVLERQPSNPLVRQNLEAAQEQLRAAEMHRDEARLRASLDEAGRLQASGDLRGAISLLEPVTERRPDWSEAWDALGSLRYMVGDADRARRDLLKANHLAPGLPDLQVRLAMTASACGRDAEAMALLDQVTEEQPLHAPAHRLRGDLLLEGKPADALLSYTACLKATSSVCEDLIRLGVALLQAGRASEARPVFETVLTIQPDHPVALKAKSRIESATHA